MNSTHTNPIPNWASWLCLLLAFLLVAGISQSKAHAAAESAIEAFKAQLSAPQPTFLEIEFDAIETNRKHEPLIAPIKLNSGETAHVVSHANDHLIALVQTNGFTITRTPLHFRIMNPDNQSADIILHFGCGYYLDKAWWMEDAQQITYQHKEEALKNSQRSLFASIQNYESLVEQVFRLGISDLIPKSFVWNGDSFTAATKNNMVIKGVLRVDMNTSQPANVDYQIYSTEGRILAAYSIAYGYNMSYEAGRLPNTIKRTTVKNTNPSPYDTDREFVIASTIVSASRAEESTFFPSTNLFAAEPRIVYRTNDTTYVYSGGKLLPVGMAPNMMVVSTDRRKYVMLLLAVTTTLFASWLAMKRKQQTKN